MLISRTDPDSRKPQLYFLSYPDAKLTRFTNDLSRYAGDSIDITQDGRSVATIQTISDAQLWLAPNGDANAAKQLTSGEELSGWVSSSDANHFLLLSAKGRIISIGVDGSKAILISGGSNVTRADSCGTTGRFLLTRREQGQSLTYSTTIDGGNLQPLGPGFLAACSPDGSWYVYQDQKNNIIRASIAGGVPQVLVTNTMRIGASISGDGKRVLYPYMGKVDGVVRDFVGIVSSDGGPRSASFVLPAGTGFESRRHAQWSPKGDAFQYSITRDGAGNIWEQPLSGGPPRQITHFPPGQHIRGFAWSPDGKQLAVVRGSSSSNVVILTDFR